MASGTWSFISSMELPHQMISCKSSCNTLSKRNRRLQSIARQGLGVLDHWLRSTAWNTTGSHQQHLSDGYVLQDLDQSWDRNSSTCSTWIERWWSLVVKKRVRSYSQRSWVPKCQLTKANSSKTKFTPPKRRRSKEMETQGKVRGWPKRNRKGNRRRRDLLVNSVYNGH